MVRKGLNMIGNKLVIPTQGMGWDSGSILFSITGDPPILHHWESSGAHLWFGALFGLPFRPHSIIFIIALYADSHLICIFADHLPFENRANHVSSHSLCGVHPQASALTWRQIRGNSASATTGALAADGRHCRHSPLLDYRIRRLRNQHSDDR